MQLVYDVEKINENGSMEFIKRFDTKKEAYDYASELLKTNSDNSIGIVPIILNDDFSEPTRLTDHTDTDIK